MRKLPGGSHAVLALLLGAYAVLLLRTAWVADDAFLSFRVVANFDQGLGLRWNADERVQIFTHPLWVLLLSAGSLLVRDLYLVALGLQIVLSLGVAVLLVGRLAASEDQAIIGLAVLLCSRAFLDYSTSGLENPLTHVLLALYVLVLFSEKRRTASLAFLASLLALSRPDAILLVAPSLGILAWRRGIRASLRELAIGFLPLLAWEAFSILYFGFPLPNTAYAKLGAGVPSSDLVSQGLLYLVNSVNVDPVTLLVTVAGIVLALSRGDVAEVSLGCGALLYLAYVVRVGGDFMSGRFLAAPLLLAVLLLARVEVVWTRFALSATLVGLLLLCLLAPNPAPLGLPPPAQMATMNARTLIDPNGIADERLFWAGKTALVSYVRGQDLPATTSTAEGLPFRLRPNRVVVGGNGMFSVAAGPWVHVVDVNALGDAFLARLPCKKGWRIGHFVRAVPSGYVKGLRRGVTGQADDPKLATYLAELELVTRGDLFTGERLRAIWDLNLGGASHLLDEYRELHSRMQVVTAAEVAEAIPAGSRKGLFSDHGIRVSLAGVSHDEEIDLALTDSEGYSLSLFRGADEVARLPLPVVAPASEDPAAHVQRLEASVAAIGYDAVEIYPLNGEDEYSLGYLRTRREAR